MLGRRMKRRMAVLLAYVLAFVLVPWASPKAATVQAATADQVMYGDRLAAPWSNWSWSSNVNLAYTATVYRGAQAISWRATAAWGVYLHTNTAVPTTPTTKLQFAVRASQANQQLSVSIYGTNNRVLGTQPLAQVGGVPPANSWKAYDVPLSKLGAAEQQVTGVVLQDAAGKAQPNVLVDEIQLVGVATGTGTPPPTTNCSTVPAYTEIRPNNTPFNQTAGRPTDPAKFTGVESWRPYYNKINGACTGTTEQILEWAAKKWGFDQLGHADLAKAMAVVETWWDQRAVGAHGEVGILQVRPGWPDWEKAQNSTAYAADYAMAVVRSHYDGNSWLGAQTTHKLRDSVAAWECGCANNGANWYATRVWEYNQSKPWKRPGQPPEWF